MTRLRTLWDSIRATYWAVPSAMVLAAVGIAFGMLRLDEAIGSSRLESWTWVYRGGPEGARAVLSTIAASMISVAGVTFSIMTVALTLASQQFGPRLLRNFLRDLGNQVVLGTFVSTFTYCLLVLRAVRGHDDTTFVPHVAVTVGVTLAAVSLGVLIYFIHHVSTSIQATQIIANVSSELAGAIARLYPTEIGIAPSAEEAADLPDDGGRDWPVVTAGSSGYVQAIDSGVLLRVASRHDLVVRVEASPGRFVRPGARLATVWPDRADRPDAALRGAFLLGAARTGTQDVAFFFEQLVELALRALSPSINDPGTACACLDRLEEALCHLAGRALPSACRRDEGGALRVVAKPATFVAMASLSLGEVARAARTSVSVTCRTLDALGAIASCLRRPEDREALVALADAVAGRARDTLATEVDRDVIGTHHRAALAALSGHGVSW